MIMTVLRWNFACGSLTNCTIGPTKIGLMSAKQGSVTSAWGTS